MDPYRFIPSERTATTIEEFLEGCRAEPTLAADQLHQATSSRGCATLGDRTWPTPLPRSDRPTSLQRPHWSSSCGLLRWLCPADGGCVAGLVRVSLVIAYPLTRRR